MPGITRHKTRSGFDYRSPDGGLVSDLDTLRRIRSLAIPPAWTAVWICLFDNGHVQATGRDKRGRKQYRYHPRWKEIRTESKYEKLLTFTQVLPSIRQKVDADLRRRGLQRERVMAAVVRLMELTLFRIGNSEYARLNNSFGLTTLRDRHVEIENSRIRLSFRGKRGIRYETDICDRRVARIIRDCRDLPGYELFQFLDDDGNRHTISSEDVNNYLREISGEEITAKDFRTWAGTNLAALALLEFGWCDTDTKRKSTVLRAVEQVAKQLGNTPAVCRSCYIHPEILKGYMDGTLLTTLRKRVQAAPGPGVIGLTPEEARVAVFLAGRA